jgi:hypothetical protein
LLDTQIYWGERDAFVVNRSGSDEYWEEIKERVKDTFIVAGKEIKKRRKFQLRVKCGDTTNSEETEDDNDD